MEIVLKGRTFAPPKLIGETKVELMPL